MNAWLSAIRLRTLPLALSSIGMGGFLAAAAGKFNFQIFFFCCLTTVFLQILSNLANDYGDSVHGADSNNRVGPQRAVQSGTISLANMKIAVFITSLFSFAAGFILLWLSLDWTKKEFMAFLGLGILCIAAAIGYTVGKKPYGYAGLGDLSVLIFFGLVGVMGSYYLMTKSIEWSLSLPALSCGLFSVAVLNINNIRDIESDVAAGKYSVPVRIGKEKAVIYHSVLLFAALLSSSIYVVINYHSAWQLLFLAIFPLLIKINSAVRIESSDKLDPWLKRMALTTLLFVILFGLGLIL